MKGFVVGVKGRSMSEPFPKRDAAVAELLRRLPDSKHGYEFRLDLDKKPA